MTDRPAILGRMMPNRTRLAPVLIIITALLAFLLVYKYTTATPVEVESKSDNNVQMMMQGAVSDDEYNDHYALEPIDGGSVLDDRHYDFEDEREFEEELDLQEELEELQLEDELQRGEEKLDAELRGGADIDTDDSMEVMGGFNRPMNFAANEDVAVDLARGDFQIEERHSGDDFGGDSRYDDDEYRRVYGRSRY